MTSSPPTSCVAPDGRLSLNYFGLARVLEQPGMTISGEFVGAPAYTSPEQITAGCVPLDHRTDIFSLGATLYELGKTREQVLAQIVHKEPKSPTVTWAAARR
jgi:serine/threonine protein kinase